MIVLHMRMAALALLDWFIPNAASSERSEIGLARNFVATHLFGPFLIQFIVIFTYLADPDPGVASWAMMACVGTFWLLPFGLRFTRDLRLMALISVELLCVTSLIGTSFYGGVNSPFLPWLLVSLMLGFFYLSDHALRVVALFAFNIIAIIGVHFVYHFPQHISPADLGAISWFSMFSATAYMSMMAIYYAGIITMRSELERETERHRLMARHLRKAKQQADIASHGKTVFLAKMKRQFEEPLAHVVASSQALLHRLDLEPAGASRQPEVARIHATSLRLLELVQDAVDPRRATRNDALAPEVLSVNGFVDGLASLGAAQLAPHGATLTIEPHRDLGIIRVDVRKLRQVCETLLGKAAAAARNPVLRLEATRQRRSTGDWIKLLLHVSSRTSEKGMPGLSTLAAPATLGEPEQIEAELEMAQLHCAVLGGSLTVARGPGGTLCFDVEIPAAPVEIADPVAA